MLQFKLRTLLLGMLAMCLASWVLFVVPAVVGVLIISCGLLVVPAYVVSGIVYFRGYRQAFCIGCAPSQVALPIVLAVLLVDWPWRYSDVEAEIFVKAVLVGAMVVSVLSGMVGVMVRMLANFPEPGSPPPLRRLKKKFPGLPDPSPRPSTDPPETSGEPDGH